MEAHTSTARVTALATPAASTRSASWQAVAGMGRLDFRRPRAPRDCVNLACHRLHLIPGKACAC